jgi:hypothetical protein
VASVVNLNRFRKDKQRTDDRKRAAENRALSGRGKKEREASADEQRRTEREFDGKRLD